MVPILLLNSSPAQADAQTATAPVGGLSTGPSIIPHHCDHIIERAQTIRQQLAIAEDGAVSLHGPLHSRTHYPSPRAALRPSDTERPKWRLFQHFGRLV